MRKSHRPKVKADIWHWPFLGINSNGAKEYACQHGVGHGGIHGCDGCPCNIKVIVAAWRETTPCDLCSATPIEYHHFDHCKKPWLRVSSLVNRGSVNSVVQEIARCEKLCRSCHMKVDGRLNELHSNKPYQKGFRLPPANCIKCNRETRPSRKGMCYTCYEKQRVGGRRYAFTGA